MNVHLVKNKDQTFTNNYSDYYSIVIGTIYTKVNDYHTAQDLAQEVFLLFYEKLDEIENKRKWLLGALRNVVMNYFSKKRHTTVDINEIFDDVNLTYTNGFRDARIVITDVMENSNNFKNNIDKVIFDLIAVKNYSFVETKNELGLTIDLVKYRYKSVCRNITDELKKKGINSIEELL